MYFHLEITTYILGALCILESKAVDLFFSSSSFLFKDFSIFYLNFFISFLFFSLSLIFNLEGTRWYDKVWQLSQKDHSHGHNIM